MLPYLVRLDANGCQGRIYVRCDLTVVKAGNRNAFGNGNVGRVALRERPNGKNIISTKNCGGDISAPHQRSHSSPAITERIRTFDDWHKLHRDASRDQGLSETRDSTCRAIVPLTNAPDDREPSVSEVKKIFRYLMRCSPVVESDTVITSVGFEGPCQHQRNPSGLDPGIDGGAMVTADQHERVDAALKQSADLFRLALSIVLARGKKKNKAGEIQFRLKCRETMGKKAIVQSRNDGADRPCSSRYESPRRAVWDVAEIGDGAQDPFSTINPDALRTVYHARDSRR